MCPAVLFLYFLPAKSALTSLEPISITAATLPPLCLGMMVAPPFLQVLSIYYNKAIFLYQHIS